MAFEEITQNLKELNENIKAFAKSSAEYYKLDLFDKTMKGATAAINGVAVAFFLVFALTFLSVAVAIVIGNWLESMSSGFFIVAGFYLLLGLFFLFFGSKIIAGAMLPGISKKFFKEPVIKAEPKTYPVTEPTVENSEILVAEEEIIYKDNERI